MKIEIGKLYQNKSKRDSFVVVTKHSDKRHQMMGIIVEYQFQDSHGNITTDVMSEQEFIENYKPQQNRNFLVCFTYSKKRGGSMCGHKLFQTFDGSFLSYKQMNTIIKSKYKDIKDDVIITNIIELSDSDYNDFIS